jgi:MFS family permease
MAEISRRFSDRKGASLAIFGIGGSFGDIFGPVITGILLGVLAWQSVISISPLIAGYLYQNWGMTATLFFTAALFAISGVIFASADLKSTRDAEVQAGGN